MASIANDNNHGECRPKPSSVWDSLTKMLMISPQMAFVLVSFSLGELGDGLNIFQGIYLVGIGWNEGSVGAALSLMGLTSLLVQPFAGDWVDKATLDRRVLLTIASVVTALSASTILLIPKGADPEHQEHGLIYFSKILEGIASSFIGPCLAALTLASYGAQRFDAHMASNILWGHIGSVVSAVLAGLVAYVFYPNIQYCFLVIGASALVAVLFVQCLPIGDPLLGRGLDRKQNQQKSLESAPSSESLEIVHASEQTKLLDSVRDATVVTESGSSSIISTPSDSEDDEEPAAAAYTQVLLDPKTCILCMTGFFFHFANANVLLVLGELMSRGNDDQETSSGPARTAIPFTALAIVTAQLTMTVATWAGDVLTQRGMGRKPLFMAGLISLPIRCALIILLAQQPDSDMGLLSTQVLDGIGGGLLGLIQPILVADITFGTGRFNVVMGLTASVFGMGATLSNFLGQMVVEHFGHIASLTGSLILSTIPILLFSFMPETFGMRGKTAKPQDKINNQSSYTDLETELKGNEYKTFNV